MPEIAKHAVAAPQGFYESGPRTGQTPQGSRKVGWTLRRRSDGSIVTAFAFLINPQGLTRTDGSRATLQATQGGFYVNDFGPAPTTIQLRQLVASGGKGPDPGTIYTAREDVQRFLKTIYLPALRSPQRYVVYFHDHQFERGFEQRVFFPANSLQTSQSVEQHGVWGVDLQMIGLELYPYGDVHVDTAPAPIRASTTYLVKAGDTLEKIVRRLAGRHSTVQRRRVVRERLLTLNPEIRKKRAKPGGGIAKPLRVYPGEKIRLPA